MATKRTSQSPDPVALFTSALASGAEVLSGVTDDQLDLRTPCTDLDVRALANHLLDAPFTIAALGCGEAYAPRPVPVPYDEWRADWNASTAAVRDVWSDDALLGKTIVLPWAELPGAAVLAQFTAEVVVHTWDLAQATGQWAEWQPEVLELSYTAFHEGLPAEGRDAFAAFGAVVAVPDDASLIDRLVAWTGRRP